MPAPLPGESPFRDDPVEHARQLLARGDDAGAEAVCHGVPESSSHFAAAQNILGVIALKAGRIDDAIAALRRAVTAAPTMAEGYNNLGEAFRRAGRAQEAVGALLSALNLRPDYPQASRNLTRAMEDLDHATLMRIGEALLAEQQVDSAAECFRVAASKRPDDPAATFNLGSAMEMQGRTADAIAQYERADKLHARDSTRLLAATRLPFIYDSHDDLLAWRRRLVENIAALRREGFRLDASHHAVPNLFLLAYQGLDDREILREYAELVAPPEHATASRPGLAESGSRQDGDGRIRVGFASMFFKSHTVGRMNMGLIAQLDRSKFHVTVFRIGAAAGEDAVTTFIKEHADEYVEIPRTLPEARQAIASRGVDLLLYTDIGMDNITWTLAHSRLAPVQAVNWGHPSTTGIPAVDYYLSADVLESADAAAHYTEKLVRLPNLGVYYYRPPQPPPFDLNRAAFGLGDDAHVYGCLQNAFKLHPDFDGVLDDILRRDPKGIVLLPRGSTRHWEQVLTRRLSRTMPFTVDRVRFFDPLPYERYLALSAACDVLLAPVHFGAGNTSYEAFAYGTPTVTLPSPFLKGRITYGLYKAMGVDDCVATSPQHFAELATRVATDRGFRHHVRTKILASNHVLYESAAGVRDIEDFIVRATRHTPS